MENTLKQGTILQGKAYRYVIGRVLGQGTFGITYLATTQVEIPGPLGTIKTTMQVAVKEFFMKGINGREDSTVTTGSKGGVYANYKVKFAREVENLSHLQHPHIVKVLEFFEANNTVYYAMEYIDGGSLEDYIKQKNRLSEEECVAYMEQIGAAVSYMHEHKMLHLDLKPGNVMLRMDGTAVLIDFGLSKQYDEDGMPETSTSVGSGTPGYAPLEQANYHEGKGFPVTMDVYALGATLFKMLTGERPPEASVVLNEGFPAHELQRHGVSERMIACVGKAMSPLKAERYQSVTAFVDCLRGEEKTVLDGSVEKTVVEEKNVENVLEKREEKEKEAKEEEKSMQAEEVKEEQIKEEPVKVVVEKAEESDGKNVQKRSKKKWWIGVAGVLLVVVVAVAFPWSRWFTSDPKVLFDKSEEYYQQGNDEKAMKWLRKSAELGYADAQYNLSLVYFEGRGVTQDYVAAAVWCRKAAEQGLAEAQYNLGISYWNALGVGQDYGVAATWYRKAAEQGYADAQNMLGLCYYQGKGVEQNYEESVKWAYKAAEQGLAVAQYNLGGNYYEGRGVAQDYGEAVKWYRKAMEQDFAPAINELGRCYEYGLGVTEDIDVAIGLYHKASLLGSDEAKNALSRLGYDGKLEVVNKVDVAEDVDENEEVFVVVEDMPSFPGGNVSAWISKNIKYPKGALSRNVEGKVYVQFIIEKDGTVTNVRIVRSVDAELDQEAVRVVSSMPRWTPGKQRGKPVRVSFTLPIDFQLLK